MNTALVRKLDEVLIHTDRENNPFHESSPTPSY